MSPWGLRRPEEPSARTPGSCADCDATKVRRMLARLTEQLSLATRARGRWEGNTRSTSPASSRDTRAASLSNASRVRHEGIFATWWQTEPVSHTQNIPEPPPPSLFPFPGALALPQRGCVREGSREMAVTTREASGCVGQDAVTPVLWHLPSRPEDRQEGSAHRWTFEGLF